MQQGVILFFVLNDTKKTKRVLQVLRERRIEQYTVLNTFGSYGLYHHGYVNLSLIHIWSMRLPLDLIMVLFKKGMQPRKVLSLLLCKGEIVYFM